MANSALTRDPQNSNSFANPTYTKAGPKIYFGGGHLVWSNGRSLHVIGALGTQSPQQNA